MTRLLVIALAALALATPAAAKEIVKAQACGEDACLALEDRQVLEILNSGGPVSQPPPAAPYVRLDFTFDAGGAYENSFSHLFVPSSGLIGANGETQQALLWFENDGVITARFREVVRGLEPYPAPNEWPRNLDESAPPTDGGTSRRPWLLAAGALLVALSAGGLLIRRLRPGRLKMA